MCVWCFSFMTHPHPQPPTQTQSAFVPLLLALHPLHRMQLPHRSQELQQQRGAMVIALGQALSREVLGGQQLIQKMIRHCKEVCSADRSGHCVWAGGCRGSTGTRAADRQRQLRACRARGTLPQALFKRN